MRESEGEGALGCRIQECDVREGIAKGGALKAVVFICRSDGAGLEHLAWLRTSWLHGFHLLHTFRARDVRAYRNLNLLVGLIRLEWGFNGPITLRLHDDPDLALSEGISPSLVRADGSRRPPRKPKVPTLG